MLRPRNRIDWLWTAILVGTGLLFISLAVHHLVTGSDRPYNLILMIAVVVFEASALVFLFVRGDIPQTVCIRMIGEHIMIIAQFGLELGPDYNTFQYVAALAIHMWVNIAFFKGSRRILAFFAVCGIVAIVWGTVLCWDSPQLSFFLIGLTVVVLMGMVAHFNAWGNQKIKEVEEHCAKIKDLEMEMLRHNIKNQTGVLLGSIEIKGDPELYDLAKRSTDSILDYLTQMHGDEVAIPLQKIMDQCVSYSRRQHSMKIHRKAFTDRKVKLRPFAVIFAVMGVFKNSSEAGAHAVEITGEDCIVKISDDGPGFDTQLLRPGFSTKGPGRGQGTALSRELCNKAGVDMTIDSVVGKGTTVTFDFAKVAI